MVSKWWRRRRRRWWWRRGGWWWWCSWLMTDDCMMIDDWWWWWWWWWRWWRWWWWWWWWWCWWCFRDVNQSFCRFILCSDVWVFSDHSGAESGMQSKNSQWFIWARLLSVCVRAVSQGGAFLSNSEMFIPQTWKKRFITAKMCCWPAHVRLIVALGFPYNSHTFLGLWFWMTNVLFSDGS